MNGVVLDTNVLVSALLADGPPSVIVDMVADGKLTPFYNGLIVSEYWDVLQRPKFDFHPLQVTRLIDAIERIGIAIQVNEPSKIPMTDKADRIFFDVAKTSHSFLITGNIKHFPQESFIVTPAEFIRYIKSANIVKL